MDLDDDEMEALSMVEVDAKDHMAFHGVHATWGRLLGKLLGVQCTFSGATGYVFISDTQTASGRATWSSHNLSTSKGGPRGSRPARSWQGPRPIRSSRTHLTGKAAPAILLDDFHKRFRREAEPLFCVVGPDCAPASITLPLRFRRKLLDRSSDHPSFTPSRSLIHPVKFSV